MTTWRSLSLRTHLLSIVLLALMPAIGLAIYMGFRLRESKADHAKMENLRLARVILLDHERQLALARNTLITLANSSQVTSLNLEECWALFRKTCAQSPAFANILLASPDGEIIASGVDLDKPITVSDREYFKEVMRTRRFYCGSYIVSRSTGKSARPMALPIFNEHGVLKGVLVGSFDLAQFGAVLARIQLPPGARATVFDGTGTILYRLPESPKLLGTKIAPEVLARASAGMTEGTYLGPEPNGEKRFFSYASGSDTEALSRIFVRVSVAQRTVYEEADRFLQRSLVGILLIALVALLLTQYISNRIILRPMNQLVVAAEQVERGQLHTRSMIPYDQGEFGHLARAFDAMTDALTQRERQRDLVEEELRTAEENLGATLLSIGDAVICTDTQTRVVRMNPVAEALTGWPISMARGRSLSEVFHVADVRNHKPVEAPVHSVLRDAETVPAVEGILSSRHGKERRISTSAAPIRTKEGIVAGAVLVFREIAADKSV